MYINEKGQMKCEHGAHCGTLVLFSLESKHLSRASFLVALIESFTILNQPLFAHVW